LGTPATPLLFNLIEHTPDLALKMPAGPACAALSRWCSCGLAQRTVLAATAATALATTPCQPPLDSSRRYETTTCTGPWARSARRRSLSAEVLIC
jgi:hypothetical protein